MTHIGHVCKNNLKIFGNIEPAISNPASTRHPSPPTRVYRRTQSIYTPNTTIAPTAAAFSSRWRACGAQLRMYSQQ